MISRTSKHFLILALFFNGCCISMLVKVLRVEIYAILNLIFLCIQVELSQFHLTTSYLPPSWKEHSVTEHTFKLSAYYSSLNSLAMFSGTSVANISTNSTNDTVPNEASWLDILQYTLFAIIFAVSTIGNILVCLVVLGTKRMRTTRNFLLVNLAVSDLTVALLCIPFDLVLKITAPNWPLGAAMCKLLWPSMTLVTNSSAVTLAVISFDR